MDFSKKLQAELNKANNEGGSNNRDNGPQRKSRQVFVNGKNGLFARILPLGDKWFAVTTKRVQMTLPKTNGEYTMSPILDMDNKDDKLAQLIKKVQHFNYEYRDSHDVDSTYDAIGLNKKPYGGGEPNTRVQTRVEFVGIQMVTDANGNVTMEAGPNGPIIRNFSASGAVYNSLLDIMADKTYKVNGQPFADSLGFVSARDTFPVQAKLHGNQWSVNPRPDIIVPTMNYNYLEKDVSGEDYKYFDDLYRFNQPLMVANPDFYERVFGQVQDIVSKRMAELKNQDAGYAGNPYVQSAPANNQETQPSVGQPEPAPAQHASDYPEPWAVSGEVPANPGKVEDNEQAYAQPEQSTSEEPQEASQAPSQYSSSEHVQTPRSDVKTSGGDEKSVSDMGNGMEADNNVDDLLSSLGL